MHNLDTRKKNILALLVGILIGTQIVPFAYAALVSRVKTFTDGSILTAADLNNEFNNLVNNLNAVDDSNISASANIDPSKIESTIGGSGIARDASTGVLSTNVDDSTLEVSGDIVQVKDDGISNAKLPATLAGDGLSGGGGSNFSVNVDDSTIEIATDTLQLKDAGITGAKLNSAIVDDSTIEISSNTLQVKDQGITQAKLSSRSTGTTVGAGGVAISNSSGAVSVSSTSYSNVTNLAITITTTGRPVFLAIISDGSTDGSSHGLNFDVNNGDGLKVRYTRDGSPISYGLLFSGSGTGIPEISGPFNFIFVDTPTAGTYTYRLQAAVIGAGDVGRVRLAKLLAYEL